MRLHEFDLTEDKVNPIGLKPDDTVRFNSVEFVWDGKMWHRKSDGADVPQGSQEHQLLMLLKGYAPDGKSKVPLKAHQKVTSWVNNLIGGPLGLASRTDPDASILGKILGTMGDGFGRLMGNILRIGTDDKPQADVQNPDDPTQAPVTQPQRAPSTDWTTSPGAAPTDNQTTDNPEPAQVDQEPAEEPEVEPEPEVKAEPEQPKPQGKPSGKKRQYVVDAETALMGLWKGKLNAQDAEKMIAQARKELLKSKEPVSTETLVKQALKNVKK